MRINTPVLNAVLKGRPELLSFLLPAADGKMKTIDLLRQEIHTDDFRVSTSRNGVAETAKGLHYRGIIRGAENSLVALSFTGEGVRGFVSDESGNYEIVETGEENIFRLLKTETDGRSLSCGTEDGPHAVLQGPAEILALKTGRENINCRPISIYFEADYTLYKNLGSVPSVTAYINHLFNQVAAIYENEGIEIRISEIKVWETPSPYNDLNNDRNIILSEFLLRMNEQTFNGDLAHLLYGAGFGGVAYVGVLGSPFRAALSGVTGNVNTYPVYSSDVALVAHELGHNFGSLHTHSCFWPGGPIDGCMAPEGDCAFTAPVPEDGGTIMSYCMNINLAKGFGPLPGAVIRKHAADFTGSNVAPVNPEVLEISRSHVRLGWEHPFFNSNFIIEYKEQGSPDWITLNTRYNQVDIQGLKPSTAYEWRVKDVCSEYVFSTFHTSDQAPVCRPAFQVTNCEMRMSGIRSVSFDEKKIISESQCTPNGYSFHMRKETLFKPGREYNFQIDYSSSGGYFGIWMDLNGNGQWEEAERLFLSGLQETYTFTGKIRIPENARTGISTRLRIVITPSAPPANSCVNSTWGEAQDYLVTLADCGGEASPPQNLRFSNITPDRAEINWEFNKSDLFKVDYREAGKSEWKIIYSAVPHAVLNDLIPLTTYEIRVSTACSEYATGKFTTAVSDYCPVSFLYKNNCATTEVIGIQRITFPGTGLDKTKACTDSPYYLFANENIRLESGRKYNFTMTSYATNRYVQLSIWVDLNGNGSFESQERVFFDAKKFYEDHINGVIEIPEGISSVKKTRMRITVNNSHTQAPCGEQTMGETLDFEIGIRGACPEIPVVATNTGPYFQGETIRLSAEGGILYEWEGPGNFSSSLRNPEIHHAGLNHAGTYTVTVTDEDDCQGRASTEVEVNPVLSKEPGHSVSVYPNPVSEILTIKTSLGGECTGTLWASSGTEIRRFIFTGHTSLKVKKMPPGVYILKVRNGETEISRKIIIL